MAYIKPTAKGYRAQVEILGVRDSASFRTKREAVAWASARETEIRENASKPVGARTTMREMLARYRDEVSPTKRGERWEVLRINAMLEMPELPLGKVLSAIQPDDFTEWRKARRRKVKPGSLLREFGLLSAAFEHARREWRYIAANPITDVRRPSAPDHRDRTITRPEIHAMLRELGYRVGVPPRSINQSIAVMFMLALRCGMRAGELSGLEWGNVHDGYCQTPHKSGNTAASMRDVPLTPKAMRLLALMRGFDRRLVFGVTPQTRDAQFRRARDSAGLSGFTFHDSRHTAATWLAQKLHILDLCKAFGWSDTKRALTYYNPTAADIAKRM